MDAKGSSPLTRGKPSPARPRLGTPGLIPAHAGKTLSNVAATFVGRAHPRSRGENDGQRNQRVPAPWLIPAHAGKTCSSYRRASWAWAHPRSRGENRTFNFCLRRGQGSSPLTRGKLTEQARKKETTRLIPAHAGKTERCPGGHGRGRAHPRSRGENGDTLKPETWGAGSSPLTRGKPVTQQLIF